MSGNPNVFHSPMALVLVKYMFAHVRTCLIQTMGRVSRTKHDQVLQLQYGDTVLH